MKENKMIHPALRELLDTIPDGAKADGSLCRPSHIPRYTKTLAWVAAGEPILSDRAKAVLAAVLVSTIRRRKEIDYAGTE